MVKPGRKYAIGSTGVLTVSDLASMIERLEVKVDRLIALIESDGKAKGSPLPPASMPAWVRAPAASKPEVTPQEAPAAPAAAPPATTGECPGCGQTPGHRKAGRPYCLACKVLL